MGRFLLGILVAVGCWLGYDRFVGSAAPVRAGVEFDDAQSAALESGVTPATADAPRTRPQQSGAPPQAEVPPAPSASEAGASGPPSYRALLSLEGPERARMATALDAAARRATTAAALLQFLGTDNAFLHSEEGRTHAARAAEACTALPRWEAVAASTRLLEVCCAGPIRLEDRDARALFDRLAERHRSLVRATVFDPGDTTRARRYRVERGDLLDQIAKEHREQLDLPIEGGTLALVNRIKDPRLLREGQVLKIPMDPIRTVVFKRAFVVAVYVGDVIVRTYWCAHGKPGCDTPETTFRVIAKIERPEWHHDGRVIPYGHPDNPLGSHFVKFGHETYTGFGIHGTDQPETIGTRASLGCIRLGAEEILEYTAFVPRQSLVEVRN